MKRSKEDILLIFYSFADVSRMSIFSVNFNIDISLTNFTSHKKLKTFVLEVSFKVPPTKNK